MVLLGGALVAERVEHLMTLAPLLFGIARREQQTIAARGELSASRDAFRQARQLSATLDGARAKLEASLIHTEQLNQELTARDRRKDEYLAMLAHELRNPLSPIIFGIELARRRVQMGELPEREVALVQRQAQHLVRLVDDLLDVSRVTQGRIELQPEEVDLRQVAGYAIEAVEAEMERKGHHLTVALPDEPVVVNADTVRLTQVITNLLTNASRHTPPSGTIELSIERNEGEAVVAVEDDGVGLPGEMLEEIFDLFVQAPRTLDRAEGGLGIGLTVVKELVQLHNGTVSAASEGPGRGSRFTVRLPLTDTAPARSVSRASGG